MQEITKELLSQYSGNFYKNETNVVAMNSVVNNGIVKSAKNYEDKRIYNHNFSIEIQTGDITSQKQSGRCWMFAALNFMRLEVMKKLNLETIELSQSYPLFWDKLEKSNYFLENIIQTLDQDVKSREIMFLLSNPMQDGGQWDMFKNIVKKYGVLPKEMMPEVVSSSATKQLNKYLTLKLREFARDLRNAYQQEESIDELRNMKDEMMETIYRMLTISLGEPPKEFTFETRDKDNEFIRIENITPQEFFAQYVGINLDDYVSIVNAPTEDKPFENTFTVKFLGNIVEGDRVKYLNLPIDELKKLAIKQMKDGKAVWFGSDVGQFVEREDGIMDLEVLQVDKLFSTTFNMSKADRLDYGESLMTHAMLLTGVNIDSNGKANRYRVENSWGEDCGKKGFFVMSDQWFDEFTYQVVIDKKYLTKEQLEMLNQEPIELAPWDPMGSLAIVK